MKDNHKMQILVKEIPTQGLELDFDSEGTPWFAQVFKDALAESYGKENHGRGNFSLVRTGQNVECEGEVACDCSPVCSRCLKVYRHPLRIPIHLTLAPLYESERQLKLEQKEEVELVKEDLEFAYYEGDRFDLGELIREQIVLALPIKPLCREDCQGLCPVCGKNRNEGPCTCRPKPADPRWRALKQLKLKSH